MRIFFDTVARRLLGSVSILSMLAIGPFAALTMQPLAAQDAQAPPAKLSPQQLDDVVARVALYPDPLLAQVMAAASFVEQITAATQWADQHSSLKGDALAQAMESANLGFDPSVQALLAFPSVLDLMNNDLAWTQALGDATLVQRGDVMDAVQRMRKQAYDAGNLKSSPQITVVQSSPQVIEIQPPNPTVIYVPTYNPQVVYVAPPPPSPGVVIAAAAIGFAVGVALSPAYSNNYWGPHPGFGWGNGTMVIYNGAWGRTWVNHSTYVHTWGGVNRGFYAKPYAYVNNNAYVRRNSYANVNRNVNVNNNVNVNRNVNVNKNTNINRNTNVNQNTNINRNANVNQNTNVNRNANANQNTSVNRPGNASQNTNVNRPGNANQNANVNRPANTGQNANANRNGSANPNANPRPANPNAARPAQSPSRPANPGNPNGGGARGGTPQNRAPAGGQNGRSGQKPAPAGRSTVKR
jgi:hypothetical protein